MSNSAWLRFSLCLFFVLAGCGSSGNSGGGGGTPMPGASLSPNGLTFTSQNIDSVSPTLTATLTNTGNASLAVNSISASGDFKESNNCPASLASTANCAIQVTFTPTAAGARTGNLSVNDNASSGTQSISLSGTGGAAVFYVAPNGNDSWTGTLSAPNAANTDGPFASFDHARTVVQSVNKTGLTNITVQFRAGTYFLPPPAAGQNSSLLFTSLDSGTSATEIIYENFPGETPVISGGMRVTSWTNTGGNRWTASLPASTANFENLFYNGVRRLRPRIGGYLGTYLRIFNQNTGTSANCPASDGNVCFDSFQYCDPTTTGTATSCDTSPVTNTWQNLAPPSPNSCTPPQPAGNGSPVGDIELLDFEQFTASKLRISCIDTASGIVYLTGPTNLNPGRNGFIPAHRYLIENVKDALTQPGQWFLDRSASPNLTLTYLANNGENPNTDTVIVPQLPQVMVAYGLQYVTFRGLTFAHDNFIVPDAGYQSGDLDDHIPAAVSFQDAQNLILDSVTVTQTAGAGMEFLSCGETSAPAWCYKPPHGSPIPVPPVATKNNLVENSAFYDLGAAGIRIGMPESQANDTDANIPQFMKVQNTVIEGWGRVFPSAFGIGQGIGHDNTYTQNDVYDGYHVGISICVCGNTSSNTSGSSNNTISFNHVHDTHQGIMNDGGAVRIGDGNGVFASLGNQIINNRVHDVSSASVMDGTNNNPNCVPTATLPCDGYGGDGIYLDNQSGSILVKNNLVYRVSENAINFPMTPWTSGISNIVVNNILAFARGAIINVSNAYPTFPAVNPPPPPNQVFQATNNLIYFDRSDTSALVPFYVQGGCTFSDSADYNSYQMWDSNMYFRPLPGVAFNLDPHAFHIQSAAGNTQPCTGNTKKWTFFYFQCTLTQSPCWQGPQGQAEDTNGVVQDPGFKNPAWPTDDFSLPNGSPGVGFTVFDTTLPGRTNPVIQPPAVPPAFQTQTFSQASDF